MGGASSCLSSEKEKNCTEKLISVLAKALKEMEAAAASGSCRNVIENGMSIIKIMDEAVMQFIQESDECIFKDNDIILNAYYDASQKAREVAQAIRNHACLSISQLKTITIAVQIYENGEYEPALEGLKAVVVDQIGLPEPFVKKLEEARDAYAEVIAICDKSANDLKHRKKNVNKLMWTVVGVCGLIGLGVVLCAVAPPIGVFAARVGMEAGALISIGEATTFSIIAGTAATAGGAVLSVPMNRYIDEIRSLARRIEEQQKLLRSGSRKAENIVVAMKRLTEQVGDLQGRVETMANSTVAARLSLPFMKRVCEDSNFRASLETLPPELESLRNTCDGLCSKVDEAYNFFVQKPGFIQQRVTKGLDLH